MINSLKIFLLLTSYCFLEVSNSFLQCFPFFLRNPHPSHSPFASGSLGFKNLSVFSIDFPYSPIYNLLTGTAMPSMIGRRIIMTNKSKELLQKMASAYDDSHRSSFDSMFYLGYSDKVIHEL